MSALDPRWLDPRWTVRRSFGSAAAFHDRSLPADDTGHGHIWIHRSDQRALVLGSTQADDLIDAGAARAAGWSVCRRRSGGGLVVIVPGTHVWIDLIISNQSPFWNDDIVRAFDWVGDLWAGVVGDLTGTLPLVHRGRPRNTSAGRLLCFAGLGAGEIEIDARKILGLSQRRTRTTARFQTMLELCDHTALVRPFAGEALAALIDATERPRIGLDSRDLVHRQGPAAALIESSSDQIRHDDVVTALLGRLGVELDEQPETPVRELH